MPELPDITAYLSALQTRILGQKLEQVRLASFTLLRTAQPALESANGRIVRELRRIGKRLAIGLNGDLWLVLHLMIAGRLHWKPAGARLAGRNPLAAFDFTSGSLILTEDALKQLDPGGIDILGSDLAAFRAALTAENRTLKRALTDPRLVSGIGNAYSDEILHAAQLSPVTLTHRLTDEDWQRLFESTQTILRRWVDLLRTQTGEGFPEKVTAFRPEMAVHGKFGQPCPRCGEEIQRIRYADNETDYCARCQTSGKLLADRGLSRLLKQDWPRTLDELEALKRR
jgi:formamidopyrimidine-DNA glycosylase